MKWQRVSAPMALLAASLRKKFQNLPVLVRNTIAIFILLVVETVLISLTTVSIHGLIVACIWLTLITLIYLFDM